MLVDLLGGPFVGGGLDRLGRVRGVYHAGELRQHAVTHELEHPAAVRAYRWLHDLAPQSLHRGERAGLIRPHQAGVAHHIGGHNRCEFALHGRRLLTLIEEDPGSRCRVSGDHHLSNQWRQKERLPVLTGGYSAATASASSLGWPFAPRTRRPGKAPVSSPLR